MIVGAFVAAVVFLIVSGNGGVLLSILKILFLYGLVILAAVYLGFILFMDVFGDFMEGYFQWLDAL